MLPPTPKNNSFIVPLNSCFSELLRNFSVPAESLSFECAQVEKDEEPQVVNAHALLPHEVFGALHGADKSKAGKWVKSCPLIWIIVSPDKIHEILTTLSVSVYDVWRSRWPIHILLLGSSQNFGGLQIPPGST